VVSAATPAPTATATPAATPTPGFELLFAVAGIGVATVIYTNMKHEAKREVKPPFYFFHSS